MQMMTGMSIPAPRAADWRRVRGTFVSCTLAAGLLWVAGNVSAQNSTEVTRGVSLFEAKKYGEAKEVFTTFFASNAASDSAVFFLGRIALLEHDLPGAARRFEKAANLRPSRSEYHHWLGRTYGQQALAASMLKKPGLAGKSRRELERAVNLDPTNVDARVDLAQYLSVAPGVMGGSRERATAQAREVLKLDPLKGRLLSALLHERSRNLAAAEREYRAATSEFPESPAAHYVLGLFLQRNGRPDEAMTTFENIIARMPTAWPAYYYLGRSGALTGRNLDRAEQVLLKYLAYQPGETDPPLSHAHLRLGMVYEQKGMRERAREQYQMSLKLDPSYREAREAAKRLGSRDRDELARYAQLPDRLRDQFRLPTPDPRLPPPLPLAVVMSITAPMMTAAASIILKVSSSPANNQPSTTATTGLT